MLYRNVDILILDEPTAVLTPQEVDELIATLKNLKEQGKTIIVITHKLREVMELADSITAVSYTHLDVYKRQYGIYECCDVQSEDCKEKRKV